MLNGKKDRIKGTDDWWRFIAYLPKGPDGAQHRRTHKWQQTKNGKEGDKEVALAFRLWLDQVEAELLAPALARQNETLAEYLEYWLKAYVKVTLEPRTYESYRDECKRHIVPEMGHIPLWALTAKTVQDYFGLLLESGRKDKKGGLSRRTVKYHHDILSAALSQAVDMGKMDTNPVKKTRLPKAKPLPTDKNKLALDGHELHAFISSCKGEYYHALIYLASYTGMRLSELLGLTWDCVDWENHTITVKQSAHITEEHGNKVRPGVKTASSMRTIDVDPSAFEVLRAHKIKQATPSKKRKRMLPPSDLPLVFKNRNGKPYQDNNVQRRFRVLADRFGLPKEFTIHNLRHSHASILIAAGWDIKDVSERLGHADIKITLSTYHHVFPDKKREAGRFFADLIQPKPEAEKGAEIIPLHFFCTSP